MEPLPAQAADWLHAVLARTKDHAVVFVSTEGRLVAWLGASERLFGQAAADVIGEPYATLFVPEDRELALHVQEMDVARSVGRSEDDRWHLRSDGSRFWGSGVLEAIVDRDGALLGYCKLVRDRTDVRTKLQALHNAVDARRAEQERRAGEVARLLHELRNCVAPALNAVRLLQRTGDEAARTRACDMLDRQMDVMKRLLDDGLEETLTEALAARRRASLRLEPIVLQDALHLAAEAVRATALERRQDLRVVVPTPPISIEADAARVHQMVVNLLTNAIKYTPEGGHVALTATVEGAMAVIRIEDDGVGIAPEVLPRIFELFTREERSPGGADGVGVGLTVVKEYAALHGGNVEARSPGVGKGTVVTLRLPLGSPRVEAGEEA